MTNPTRRKHRPTTRQRRKHRQINPPHPPAAATDDAAAIPEAPAVAAAIGIPDDVFFSHIFVNLPVRSLSRFRAVCRSWHAAVDDPALVRRHLELSRARQPPTSSLLAVASSEDVWDEALSDSDSEVVSFHRLTLTLRAAAAGPRARAAAAAVAAPPHITSETDPMLHKSIPNGGRIARRIIPTHCDGLVAVATYGGATFVCNPATQELVVLPPGTSGRSRRGPSPGSTESTAAIGFDPWRNRYVVARCFYYRKSGNHYPPVYNVGHEIFTLGGGAGDGWRRTQDPPRAISPDGRPAACTRGGGASFYWFIDEHEPCALLRFSLRDEAFDVVPCPPGCTAFTYDDRLADLAGELCYVHRVRTGVATHEVWMAAAAVDDDEPEWWLRYRVDLWGYAWGLVAGERWFHSFGATAGDDGVDEEATLVTMLYKELCWHRERSKPVVKDVNVRGSRYSCEPTPTIHHVIRYVESLVSITAPNY
uniref:F-box domain-containing protein n=1 Tax=Oryza rufipogon TaxID=4529 RepID=A0A0E0P877_ORYRU